MQQSLRLLVIAVTLVTAAATARADRKANRKKADDTAVAVVKVEKVARWFACGVIHSVGEVEVEVLKIESGELPEGHIAVEISCPVDAGIQLGGTYKMRLRSRRPGWPKATPTKGMSKDLPRRYATRTERVDTD